MDDGDTVSIAWGKDDVENVRILGIDTPETRHLEHNLPYPQDFGPEARGFALGAFAAATEVQLLRASTVDPFGASLQTSKAATNVAPAEVPTKIPSF